ncbi:Hypothetical predicted protein [Cloeon dipterum]|uniref:Uncharacterized protein n=1 Tax=Cloeon dipterum TaxID=197152 RepID=A0A8S1CM85_9INSE|nr:Hypothetical predicted protein [Cloeon dipterum]
MLGFDQPRPCDVARQAQLAGPTAPLARPVTPLARPQAPLVALPAPLTMPNEASYPMIDEGSREPTVEELECYALEFKRRMAAPVDDFFELQAREIRQRLWRDRKTKLTQEEREIMEWWVSPERKQMAEDLSRQKSDAVKLKLAEVRQQAMTIDWMRGPGTADRLIRELRMELVAIWAERDAVEERERRPPEFLAPCPVTAPPPETQSAPPDVTPAPSMAQREVQRAEQPEVTLAVVPPDPEWHDAPPAVMPVPAVVQREMLRAEQPEVALSARLPTPELVAIPPAPCEAPLFLAPPVEPPEPPVGMPAPLVALRETPRKAPLEALPAEVPQETPLLVTLSEVPPMRLTEPRCEMREALSVAPPEAPSREPLEGFPEALPVKVLYVAPLEAPFKDPKCDVKLAEGHARVTKESPTPEQQSRGLKRPRSSSVCSNHKKKTRRDQSRRTKLTHPRRTWPPLEQLQDEPEGRQPRRKRGTKSCCREGRRRRRRPPEGQQPTKTTRRWCPAETRHAKACSQWSNHRLKLTASRRVCEPFEANKRWDNHHLWVALKKRRPAWPRPRTSNLWSNHRIRVVLH